MIQTVDRASVLAGVAILAGGTVTVANNTSLTLQGALANAGTLLLASANNYTALAAAGAVTLQGGTVQMSDNFENRVTSDGAAAALANAGAVAGAGRLGDGDGNLSLSNTGTVFATGANALVVSTPGHAVINAGTLGATGAGGLQVLGDVANAGLVWADGGRVFIGGAVTGAEQGRITGAAALEFGGAVSAGQAVEFDVGATGTLVLDASAAFAGVIAGLARDGSTRVDLADLGFAGAVGSYSGTVAGGTLQVANGTRTVGLAVAGNYVGASVALADDGRGHVLAGLIRP